MVMAFPRIHMICGACGNKDMLSFKINPRGNCNNEGIEYPSVTISCDNCATLTSLCEVIEDRTDHFKEKKNES